LYANKKSSPPSDWTGGSKPHSGEMPSLDVLRGWLKDYPQGNIAVSPPRSVLGLDVDLYDGKAGGATLAAAVSAWGELPPTWVSTSRQDGSGIRFYRIPEGLAWPGQLTGGGVELIRWDHRYAVVMPSVHPNGSEYHWVTPLGVATSEEFPSPEDLPELPAAWVEGLTQGKKWVRREEADLDDAEVNQWIIDRGDHELCAVMDRTLRKALLAIRHSGADGGAHDSMKDGIWAVVGDSFQGHHGLSKALGQIRAAFYEAGKDRGRAIKTEYARAKAGAIAKVVAEGEPEDDDLCELNETSRAPKERKRVGMADVEERNDAGNARRFAARYRHSVRWVPAFATWFIWSDRLGVWVQDTDGEAMRMATETAAQIRAEAEFEEDDKIKTAILRFAVASGNDGRLKAMLARASDLKGMTAAAESFNANIFQLVCTNGTVELPLEFSGGSVRRVPSLQEHYNTIQCGTEYHPDAVLPEWEKFLERFQPDPEVREWLQKLAGYSLLGANPRRLMVVCIGDTSTGKTTFAEAISGALGPYAGSANMTIFRDNQDEKPRPDLIRVLPKRFVYAEEASRSWHLHPDQIKRLTGGAPITARTLQAKIYVDMVPRFTPWLLTNAAPTIEGADAALWRRIVTVPFDVQIPQTEEDAGFRERLGSPEGRQAVLAWLVEGYRQYLLAPDSLQEIPAGAMVANAKFRSEISDLAICLEDLCEFGEGLLVAPDALYQAYKAWCATNGVQPRDILSSTKFGREISGEYPKQIQRIDGKPVRMRVGLALKSGWLKVLSGG
jgi:P4 family phage/plasmid primase-like protien